MLLKSSTVELLTNGRHSTRAIFWCPGGQPTHSLSSLQWLSPCNGNGHENAFLLPNLSTTAVNQGLTNSIYFFVQPRSQGLFLGLGAGRGKGPGNEVVSCRKRSRNLIRSMRRWSLFQFGFTSSLLLAIFCSPQASSLARLSPGKGRKTAATLLFSRGSHQKMS